MLRSYVNHKRIENVNNPSFAVNFVSPTPSNGSTVHTDYVDVAVEVGDYGVGPFEGFVLFDNSSLNFSGGSFADTKFQEYEDFINLTGLSGSFTSVVFDAGKNTTWDNLSWSEVLPVSEEIIPDENTVLLFHLNNDSNYGKNDTHIFDFSSNGNNGTAYNSLALKKVL